MSEVKIAGWLCEVRIDYNFKIIAALETTQTRETALEIVKLCQIISVSVFSAASQKKQLSPALKVVFLSEEIKF